VGRNCHKFFPGDVDPKRKDWWQPDYRIGDQFIVIRGVSTNECPTSLVTGFTDTMIRLYLRNKNLPNLNIMGNGSEMPAKVVDAMEVLAIEESRTDRELEIAIRTPRL